MAHNHKQMNGLLAFLLFIVTLPFVILGLVVFGLIYLITTVLPAPIEIIIYKHSQFYRDLHIKYFLGITSNFGYKTYKYVKQNPNLEIVFQDNGYYYYKSDKTILVIPYYAEYYNKDDKWQLTMSKDGEAIEPKDVKPTFEPLIKEDISDYEIKLLVKEKFFKKEQVEAAKQDPVFVFYKNYKDFDKI